MNGNVLPFPMPQTADDFITLMESIWEIETVPENGGVVLYSTALYNDWHDAIKVARAIGLQRTGGSHIYDWPANVYRFGNGDGVVIKKDGDGVRKASRFTRRSQD